MISMIENGTVGLLSLALDATAMRQQAIARNIANAGTPGYQRLGVNFEARLDAVRQELSQGRAPSAQTLQASKPAFEPIGTPGDSVALDTEMAALSENTLHHQVLLKALTKHFALIDSAIAEGKR